jgi:putative endopeptidase
MRHRSACLPLLLAVGCATAPRADLPSLDHFRASIVDPAIDPCEDFYRYADGKWIAAHPIAEDEVERSMGGALQLWNESVLRQILEKVSAADPARTANEQKAGDYYFACMDAATTNALTAQWLEPELARIDRIASFDDVADELALQHHGTTSQAGDQQTRAALFGFAATPDLDDSSRYVAGFDQGGLSLPGRSFYLDDDEKAKDVRAKFLGHVAATLVLAGETPERARADAATVLDFETSLARAAMDPVVRRDSKNLNNKFSLEGLQALAPSFPFARYLKDVQAPPTPQYLVASVDFFKNLEAMVKARPLAQWKTYLRWQLLLSAEWSLSDAFVDEAFSFWGKVLEGQETLDPRWRRCVRAVDGSLGEVLGQVYVARVFKPESKARALRMVQDVEEALARDVDQQDWMSPPTRAAAKAKLAATLNKIGYPDTWRDTAGLAVGRASAWQNRKSALAFEYDRAVAKIGRPVDRMEWVMSPPSVAAWADPQSRTVNFPAGILGPPFFDAAADDAVNYGATGMVMGHEVIHHFDDDGRKFDARGNLADWWTEADAKEYEKRSACLSDQYTAEILPGVRQDGKMTLGEDLADNGGLHLAFMALQAALSREGRSLDAKEADGLTPRQRFFLSFAFAWSASYRPELARTMVLTDPHSLPNIRVNNVVSNMPEFREAFGCRAGQRMVREPSCRVW